MAFLVWFSSVAFILVIPSIAVLPYIFYQKNILTDKTALTEFVQTDPTTVLISLIAIIPAHILTLLAAWLVVTKFKKYSFKEMLGWNWGGFNFWNGLLVVVGIFAASAITSYFIPEQDNDLLKILRSSREAVYIVAFLATLTAPLVEEVVYRGVLYSSLQKYWGVPLGVIITTFLFAVVHVPQYWGSSGTILMICLLSLVLTLVRVGTKNLLPCIVLHTVFNGIQSLLLIFQPYLDSLTVKKAAASIIHILTRHI